MKYFSEKLYEMFDTMDELKAAEKKYDQATGKYEISRAEAYKATVGQITVIDAKSVLVEKKIVELTNNFKSALAKRNEKGVSDFVADMNYKLAAKELAGVQKFRDELAEEYRNAIEKLGEMRGINDVLFESELNDDGNDIWYDAFADDDDDSCCGDCDECDHYDTCCYDEDDEYDEDENEDSCGCDGDCAQCSCGDEETHAKIIGMFDWLAHI